MKSVVFIADYFASEMLGGSELSLKALIKTCPYLYREIKSSLLNLKEAPKEDLLIFGNYNDVTEDNLKLLKDYKHIAISSDYLFCRYRSPKRHEMKEHCFCNCKTTNRRAKFIFDFLESSKYLFWKSIKQRDFYHKECPKLVYVPSIVLSATFTHEDLDLMCELRDIPKNGKTAILKSEHIVKDYAGNCQKCRDLKLDFEAIGDLPYREFLKKLAGYSKFLYHPSSNDTCPRSTCEARMVGCDVMLGEFVEHKNEQWFSGNLETMENYLRSRTGVFWKIVGNLL